MNVWQKLANAFLWAWRDIGTKPVITPEDYVSRKKEWLQRGVESGRITPADMAKHIYMSQQFGIERRLRGNEARW